MSDSPSTGERAERSPAKSGHGRAVLGAVILGGVALVIYGAYIAAVVLRSG
ncbi:MAG: hypothetical protein AAFX85_17405 [Pseudomonadota bacterium]